MAEATEAAWGRETLTVQTLDALTSFYTLYFIDKASEPQWPGGPRKITLWALSVTSDPTSARCRYALTPVKHKCVSYSGHNLDWLCPFVLSADNDLTRVILLSVPLDLWHLVVRKQCNVALERYLPPEMCVASRRPAQIPLYASSVVENLRQELLLRGGADRASAAWLLRGLQQRLHIIRGLALVRGASRYLAPCTLTVASVMNAALGRPAAPTAEQLRAALAPEGLRPELERSDAPAWLSDMVRQVRADYPPPPSPPSCDGSCRAPCESMLERALSAAAHLLRKYEKTGRGGPHSRRTVSKTFFIGCISESVQPLLTSAIVRPTTNAVLNALLEMVLIDSSMNGVRLCAVHTADASSSPTPSPSLSGS